VKFRCGWSEANSVPRLFAVRWALLVLGAGALGSVGCSRGGSSAAGAGSGVAGARTELVFQGACDASGAVALTDTLFAVGDDEDNVLRVYDANRGGPPVTAVDVSDRLDLTKSTKRKKKSNKPSKAPELDIEAATRVGDLAFWITSHGRNSSGKLKPERFRFFATTAPREGQTLEVVGTPYERLLPDLLADARFASFDLQGASELAPKDRGGLNIEGLSERAGGGVLIGFRNPTPNEKALLIGLLNPEEVVHGKSARFSDPVLVDLDGLGVRSLSRWRGRYLIVAGHYATSDGSRLYAWNGRDRPERLPFEFRQFNPEGFFTPDQRNDIMLLSDDGGIAIDGTDCKRLEDASLKRFRGAWLSLPLIGGAAGVGAAGVGASAPGVGAAEAGPAGVGAGAPGVGAAEAGPAGVGAGAAGARSNGGPAQKVGEGATGASIGAGARATAE
jgi:hypothetical protein